MGKICLKKLKKDRKVQEVSGPWQRHFLMAFTIHYMIVQDRPQTEKPVELCVPMR